MRLSGEGDRFINSFTGGLQYEFGIYIFYEKLKYYILHSIVLLLLYYFKGRARLD